MDTQVRRSQASSAAPAAAHYITFKLGDEVFAINVAQVREVLDLSVITKLPTAPEYLRGVVNVRGSATTVVDLRLKFGLPRVPDTAHTRIIVLEVMLDGQPCVIGGLADSVHEVVELDASQIAPPPAIGMRWRTDLIQGVSRRGDQFIIIFDIEKVFASDGAIRAVAAASE
jgi:purine-binding chemotaxis protein CheW